MQPTFGAPISRIRLHCSYIKANCGVNGSLYMLNKGYKAVNIKDKLAKTCQRGNRSRVKYCLIGIGKTSNKDTHIMSWPKHAKVETDQGYEVSNKDMMTLNSKMSHLHRPQTHGYHHRPPLFPPPRFGQQSTACIRSPFPPSSMQSPPSSSGCTP